MIINTRQLWQSFILEIWGNGHLGVVTVFQGGHVPSWSTELVIRKLPNVNFSLHIP